MNRGTIYRFKEDSQEEGQDRLRLGGRSGDGQTKHPLGHTELYDDRKMTCLARQWVLSAWIPKERTGLEIIESSSAYRGCLKLWEADHKQQLSRA